MENARAKAEYVKRQESLAEAFRTASADAKHVGLKKSASNLFRSRETSKTTVDVRDFVHVLSIDEKHLTAEVEGMITFGDLIDQTLEHGLLPPVVPELMTITLGGAISGVGIEASSFRYGLVHENVLEMEVLTGEGNVVTCSRDVNSDLFLTIPNSYGSLGYVIRATIPLIKTKPFVKLTHTHYGDARSFFNAIQKEVTKGNNNFLEGVIFGEEKFYTTTGEFVDSAPYTSDYTYMSRYYRSICARTEDYLTVRDFIRRWDSDWFWTSKHFGMHNNVLRFLFGKLMLNSKAYWKVRRWAEKYLPESKKEAIVQDVAIPIENAEKFLKFFNKEIGITPIWICPTQSQKNETFPLFKLDPNVLYMDFGFWDVKETHHEKGYYNKLIEGKVEELGGKKSLYSHVYYEQEKFWGLYNKDAYEKVKQKYDPQGVLKNLYEKVTSH